MPIELNERLSEFSYGYGVTREVEDALSAVGLTPVPFLPSLVHEAELGFDVAFDRPGAPLLLQFKLGQAMQRFVPGPAPLLERPFWRFRIDTAEPDGQYELLLKAEQDGAEVYYVAPKFHDWEAYLGAYKDNAIIHSSLFIRPTRIRKALDDEGLADGKHKIVYDEFRTYLCSDPHRLKSTSSRRFARLLRRRIENSKTSLGQSMRQVFEGFDDRAKVRRPREAAEKLDKERLSYSISSDIGHQPESRNQRFAEYQLRAQTPEDAVAAAVGVEAWACGVQLVMVVLE